MYVFANTGTYLYNWKRRYGVIYAKLGNFFAFSDLIILR